MSEARNTTPLRLVDNVFGEMHGYEKKLLASYASLNTNPDNENIMMFLRTSNPEMYNSLKMMADLAVSLQRDYPDKFLQKVASADGSKHHFELDVEAYKEYLQKTEALIKESFRFNEDYGLIMFAVQNNYLKQNKEKSNEFTAFTQIPIMASQKTTRNNDLVASAENLIQKDISKDTGNQSLKDVQSDLVIAKAASQAIADKYARTKNIDSKAEVINILSNLLNEYSLAVRREGRSDKNIKQVNQMFIQLNAMKSNGSSLEGVRDFLEGEKNKKSKSLSLPGKFSKLLDDALVLVNKQIENEIILKGTVETQVTAPKTEPAPADVAAAIAAIQAKESEKLAQQKQEQQKQPTPAAKTPPKAQGENKNKMSAWYDKMKNKAADKKLSAKLQKAQVVKSEQLLPSVRPALREVMKLVKEAKEAPNSLELLEEAKKVLVMGQAKLALADPKLEDARSQKTSVLIQNWGAKLDDKIAEAKERSTSKPRM